MRELLRDKAFAEIVGLDVSHRALEIASRKLRLEDLPRMQKERIRLIHGSLTYRDKRLAGYDAAPVAAIWLAWMRRRKKVDMGSLSTALIGLSVASCLPDKRIEFTISYRPIPHRARFHTEIRLHRGFLGFRRAWAA